MTGFGSPTDRPPMAMPVQSPRARVPSSERRRSSSWVPPWTMGQRVCTQYAAPPPLGPTEFSVPPPAPLQPAQRLLHPLFGKLPRSLPGHHVVECHRDVGAERPLDLHGRLGGEPPYGAVDMAGELDAFLFDGAQPRPPKKP